MSSLLPLRPSVNHTPRSRSEIDLADEDSTAVFEALGSEMARRILETLGDHPATASDLADEVGSSLQNVQYHLESLHDAELIVEAGTWYSSKGKEMRVYALSSEHIELRLSPGHDDARTSQGIDAQAPSSEQPTPFRG